MKGLTEAKLRVALNQVEGLMVYKIPDDARNWKPADFAVWWQGGSALIEVKDNPAASTFPLAEIRPSQRQGIAAASSIGLPYWLCIWWRSKKAWTISNAGKLMDWVESHDPKPPSVRYAALASRFGVEAQHHQLGSTLRTMLEDG